MWSRARATALRIVLLHGYSDTHKSFDLMRPYLPRACRAIVVTQRGHGLSDKPRNGYAVSDFAADIPALLDAFGIKRALIVGRSMGAAVAMQAAADYPERVAGVVLIGGFARFQGNSDIAQLSEAVGAFGDTVDGKFVLAFQESMVAEKLPQNFLETVVGESLKCPAYLWKAALEGMLACDPLAAAARC